MKAARKIVAIGMCGVMLGGIGSVMLAPSAGARVYSSCDSKIERMEAQSARDYAKGKLSAEDYERVQAEIAYHRELWGC